MSAIPTTPQAMETFLCRNLASYLDIPPAHRIHRDRPLYSQGVDSLTALALQRRLEHALRIPVPASYLLRENSVSELAAVLADLACRATASPGGEAAAA
ncbi:acyl carrier protein [Streptomyces sp. NPDC005574]|uniref:acyl carrier protein n=1 Tax=Streptomyces sp. NPDC005574 TaxID=3156891 RepID=UPI0033B4ADFA